MPKPSTRGPLWLLAGYPEEVSDRLSKIARRLRPLSRGLSRQLVPAARLARIDATVLRAWASRVGAVRDALGPAESMGYTRLVVAIAEVDVDIARIVAYTLPDHLARIDRKDRARYLALLRAVLRDRTPALPLVVRTLPDLIGRLDDENLARYLSRGLALHGQSSRKAESFFKMESTESQQVAGELQRGTTLASVRRTLTLYARAHCGEDVQIRPGGEQSFTDGRHIYLPEQVDHFGDERDFLVYRVLTARNAGYLEFGTLDLELDDLGRTFPTAQPGELASERFVRGFTNTALARDLLTIFENARIEAQVRNEYPGIARDMDKLGSIWRPVRPTLEKMTPVEQAIEWLYLLAAGREPPSLEHGTAAAAAGDAAAEQLRAMMAPDATVLDAAQATLVAYPALEDLMRKVQDDDLNPIEPPDGDPSAGAGGGGGEEEDEASSTPSPEPAPGRSRRGDDEEDGLDDYRPMADDPMTGALDTDRLSQADRAVEEQARALLTAMREGNPDASLQEAREQARDDSSYEEMAEFLDRMHAPAGPMAGHKDPDRERVVAERQSSLDEGDADDQSQFLYPEWDTDIEDHKPSWIRLTEYTLPPGNPDFVEQVRREHGPMVGQLRRAFEALRPEAVRRVRGVNDGDEIDIDLAIAARLERRSGGSPSDRIYTRRLRQERDVAVAFLLDMSSSTNEVANADGKRILDVEKEALVLICEAVDAIGDACAIYGFSGYGRDSVAFYIAKDFEDRWDSKVTERIGRISWKMENRDGAAIRHCTQKLAAAPQKVKLLLLLSDGKPLDCGCDHYADFYAQEDTRMALREARQQGIHPFCITVDPHGQEYLSRMYGEHGYIVIDRVEALPIQLPRIYRRLTR